MRSDTFAVYKDKEYWFVKKQDGFFHLVSMNPDDAENGFIPYHEVFVKKVSRNEISHAYIVETYCTYKGYRFFMMLEKDVAAYIHTSDGILAKSLQMEMSEPFSYEMWVRLDELDSIWEEREPVYDLPFLTDPIKIIK